MYHHKYNPTSEKVTQKLPPLGQELGILPTSPGDQRQGRPLGESLGEIFQRELKTQELGGTLSIFVWGTEKHAFEHIKCRGFDFGSLLDQSIINLCDCTGHQGSSPWFIMYHMFRPLLPTCDTLPNGARPLHLWSPAVYSDYYTMYVSSFYFLPNREASITECERIK